MLWAQLPVRGDSKGEPREVKTQGPLTEQERSSPRVPSVLLKQDGCLGPQDTLHIFQRQPLQWASDSKPSMAGSTLPPTHAVPPKYSRSQKRSWAMKSSNKISQGQRACCWRTFTAWGGFQKQVEWKYPSLKWHQLWGSDLGFQMWMWAMCASGELRAGEEGSQRASGSVPYGWVCTRWEGPGMLGEGSWVEGTEMSLISG